MAAPVFLCPHMPLQALFFDVAGTLIQPAELVGLTYSRLALRHGVQAAPDDLMLLVESDQVLFAGDLYFNGRLPFVVDGNTRNWLAAIELMRNLAPRCIVPGHGAASCDPAADLATTAGYLHFVREAMGRAVEDLADFDSAYTATDWSRYSALPTFDAANRRNAYSVYLEMQAELLGGADAPR